jgi:protein tyrosine phosphatase (PTP) superfamily phosphohydrolase (DUF442 family)
MSEHDGPPSVPPTLAALPTPPRRSRRRRIAWLVVAVVLLPVALKAGDVVIGENYHTVVAGELYRSAQLSGPHLERHIRAEGIRTVINLRGPNAGRDWYDDEVAVCEQMGVRHIDVRISARELPPPAEAAALMSALHNAAKPILVHCNGGADRSGLACAAYLVAEHGSDAIAAASGQLSLWYGHLPVGKSQETNHFFTMYSASQGIPLRAWVNAEYPSLYEAQRAVRAMPPIANAPFWQVALVGLIAAALLLWRAARVG